MTRFQFQNGDRPLDGYTIEYALGRGGFGEVYYAVSDAGRQVALKAVQNYEEIELRGIGHCMNLKSQHLVSIFDVKKSADGMPWVIMEFVAGPSLRDILDESPQGIGPEKSSFFVRELAKGLSYLHAAGVVHRDLKPHNVFFEDGVVKIGDYSLSKAITSSHRSGHTMTVGTVHYMAPEIGMGRYDKTVDIYALGVMLFEMLTGVPPYTGDSMGEVLMKHLSAEPDVTGLQEPFAAVVRKAMQRDPADRYESAEEMAAALHGIDPVADMTTGFGPASLSIVADRAAKKARPASEDSTGRIDAALETTQYEQHDHEVHPMRQLGRDLGRLGFHAGIIGDSNSLRRAAATTDPVSTVVRILLASLTLLTMAIVGAALAELIGTPHPGAPIHSQLIDGAITYYVPSDTRELTTYRHRSEEVVRIMALSLLMIIGAVAVRALISRGILPERGKRCRVIHAIVCFAIAFSTFFVFRSFGLSPVYGYFVTVMAAGMPIVVQNWCLFTSPMRPQRVRFWPVFFASAISFVAAEIVGADSIICVASACGSILSVQIGSRWSLQTFDRPDRDDQRASAAAQAETQPAAPVQIHSLVAVE